MAGEKFKLNFITNGEGIKIIDEPVGFDAADFTLKQESKRLSRDISFAGGESKFKFYRHRNHYIDTLFYYYETFGWESEVQLIIEIDGFDNVIGDFDFFTASTDLIEYFSCKIVQSKKQALIKKRSDVKVDLFSNKDLDDNDILPLITENILVKAKSIKQISEWKATEYWANTGSISGFQLIHQNAINQIIKSDIDETLTNLKRQIVTDRGILRPNQIKEQPFLEAQDNIKDLQLNISNFKLSYFIETGSNFSYNGITTNIRLRTDVGIDTDTNKILSKYTEIPYTLEFIGNESAGRFGFEGTVDRYDLTFQDTTIEIGNIPRANILYMVFNMGRPFAIVEWLSGNIKASASSISYNTIAPSVRLHDAVSKTVEAVSQLPISFPFAEPNGEMYNQMVLSGNMLRNILDKPFYFSMKDIESWLPEINGDYEVGEESVYFGLYKDFYKNIECGYFDTVKFDDYEKMFNEKYAINQFNYKYSKYQSQKENDVDNTYDVVHGESEWLVPNVFVENKKEISVDFVRDAFMIAETQKKALKSSESTATQEDDTIFIIDTVETLEDYVFIETDFLQHTFDESLNKLTLKNTSNFSFILIGITAGTQFKILGIDTNAGNYIVSEVGKTFIILTGSNASKNNDGERITQFEYIVTKETAPYRTWGNEGFTIIDNINNTEDYANLKYSIKRNIVRFYNQYLATCNLYAKKSIKNTYYKNNPDAILNYEGFTTNEGESFIPTNPILSPYIHTITLITDFATYKTLENEIRDKRGYIRVVDKEDFVLKLYPMEMTYVNSSELGELTIKGEEKYEQSLVNIAYNDLGYITINDYYRTSKVNYKEKDEKFYIFDESNRLLYKPLFWNRISINGAIATSKTQLIEWLTLIS